MPLRAFFDSDIAKPGMHVILAEVLMPLRAFFDSDGKSLPLLHQRCRAVLMPLRAFFDSDASGVWRLGDMLVVLMPLRAFFDSDSDRGARRLAIIRSRLNALAGIF